jgi:hypothetical protein
MQLLPDWIDRRPDGSEGETFNNQLSAMNCFNEEETYVGACLYPDTNDVSSASKVVALSIARNRTRE